MGQEEEASGVIGMPDRQKMATGDITSCLFCKQNRQVQATMGEILTDAEEEGC